MNFSGTIINGSTPDEKITGFEVRLYDDEVMLYNYLHLLLYEIAFGAPKLVKEQMMIRWTQKIIIY